MRSGNFAKGEAGPSAGSFGRREAFGVRPAGGYDIRADAQASFAADREGEAASWVGPNWGAKLRRATSVTAIVVGLLVYVVLSNFVKPIRYWDAVTLVGIAVVPAELVILFFLAEDHPLAARNLFARAFAGNPLDWLEVLGLVGMFGVGVPAVLVLFANERLDHAPSTIEVLPIETAWTHRHRSTTTYLVGVEPKAHAPSPFFSFYDVQPISLTQAHWEEVMPGRSTVTLRVHPGRLGLSWYEMEDFTP